MTTRVRPKQASSTKRSPRKVSASRQASTTKANGAAPSQPPAEPDLDAALRRVLDLLAIRGGSGHEAGVASYVTQALREAGADAAAIRTDDAHHRTPIAGDTGNLIFTLPGTLPGPRRLLMAHMDTVPICVGARPVLKGNWIRAADKQTGLGADDRAGVAVLLSTAVEILRRGLPHPPLTFLWAIQEETGLHGARCVDRRLLERPKLAFNWDGGPADKITVAATGGYRLAIEVTGKAAHAGSAPQEGVSAIGIASLAIADLMRDGWHGAVRKGSRQGTSNVGVIRGGDATNVVTERVELRAEARSHDPKFRATIVTQIKRAFEKAAASVRSASGDRGKIHFEGQLDYESFHLPPDEPCVVRAEQAARSIGLEPWQAVSNGGLDANWMTAHGIPTVTLGCGQCTIHTTSERLDLTEFRRACRMALRLATGAV